MRYILVLIIAVYTALFSWLCYAQFQGLTNSYPQDLAAQSQECWNTWHGRFLQQTVLYVGGANHLYLIFALFAPIYGVANNIFVLFFLYSLIAALGAIPVYLLARDNLESRNWGLLLAVLYLAYPGLHYLNLLGLKTEVLTLPLLLSAFYFWQRRNLSSFLTSVLIASMMTELVCFFVMMFALLSWFDGRDKRWIKLPVLIAMATLVITHLVFVPLISGNFSSDIERNKFFRYFNLFSWYPYQHIFDFLGTAIILVIASWESLFLAVPYLSLGIFTKVIHTHHYFPLTIILFIALIFGLKRILKLDALRNVTFLSQKMMVITAGALILFYVFDPLLVRPGYYHPMRQTVCDAWSLMQHIPQTASVTCDPVLLPALSRRERLHEFSRKEYCGKKINYLDVDYILIDPLRPHRESGRHDKYQENVQRLLEQTRQGSSGFEIVDTRGDWVLLQRKRSTKGNI